MHFDKMRYEKQQQPRITSGSEFTLAAGNRSVSVPISQSALSCSLTQHFSNDAIRMTRPRKSMSTKESSSRGGGEWNEKRRNTKTELKGRVPPLGRRLGRTDTHAATRAIRERASLSWAISACSAAALSSFCFLTSAGTLVS